MFDTRRQTIRLPKPGTQLKLPFLLLVLTAAFAGMMVWHTHVAYDKIYTTTMEGVSSAFQANVHAQTADFMIVSAALVGGYVLVLLGVCIGYTHALIGPIVALQRQARKLRSGDFTARTQLRRSDTVFTELAHELNAVAEQLEKHSETGWRR